MLKLSKNYENYENKPRIALCLLIVDPNEIYLDLLNTFNKYDVYVCLDNNSINLDEITKKYPTIHFIQFPDEKVIEEGYYNVNYIFSKKTTSWDKALYHFSKIDISYEYVWFIEYDVYIPNQESLINLDKHSTDLICKNFNTNTDGHLDDWPHWGQAPTYFELPWAEGLQCICRLSNKVLGKIKEFVDTHKKLTFLEVLFTTIVIQNNYTYVCPDEFIEVDCCKKHNISELDPKRIYHPIKNLDDHKYLRDKLK
jgi:hypothetical protein